MSNVEGQKSRFRFEQLDVWQNARQLNRMIYRLTRHFPAEEQFGITSQMRRASVSVSSNIAEGCGRNSDKDFAHFLEQAYGSAMEVASQLFLALDEGYASKEHADVALANIQKLSAQIAALNRSLKVEASKVNLRNGR